MSDLAPAKCPECYRWWAPDDRPANSEAIMATSQALHEMRRAGGDFGKDRTGEMARRLVASWKRQGFVLTAIEVQDD